MTVRSKTFTETIKKTANSMEFTLFTVIKKPNSQQKHTAARICYDAFAQKFRVMWLFDDDAERGASVLFGCLNYDNGLYAVSEGQLLGFIGLEHSRSRFKTYRYAAMKDAYGIFGACWRVVVNFLFFSLFDRVKKGEVHIDALATAADARGMGVGTMLLSAAFEQAKRLGYSRITLEVVDTNPRAKKLYQKLGFVVRKTTRSGRLTASAGFMAVDRMVKTL